MPLRRGPATVGTQSPSIQALAQEKSTAGIRLHHNAYDVALAHTA